jgi:hypothetical protein
MGEREKEEEGRSCSVQWKIRWEDGVTVVWGVGDGKVTYKRHDGEDMRPSSIRIRGEFNFLHRPGGEDSVL